MGSEKPPPMMARSKAIFARRNVLSMHSPPPAFLIGLPPPPAQPSGVETEGQTNMGMYCLAFVQTVQIPSFLEKSHGHKTFDRLTHLSHMLLPLRSEVCKRYNCSMAVTENSLLYS